MKEKGEKNDYAVGKRKPPKASRWRKGQCGNKDRKPRRPPNDAELIERLFRKRYDVVVDGLKTRMTGFEIIFEALVRKEAAGDRRAARARDRYLDFARAHLGSTGVVLRRVGEAQTFDASTSGADAFLDDPTHGDDAKCNRDEADAPTAPPGVGGDVDGSSGSNAGAQP